jgi:hypothetical protein
MSKIVELPNGASPYLDPKIGKWAVFAPDGNLQGYRRDEARAREFALSLKGERVVVPEPALINISHRAHPETKGRLGVPAEEPTGPRADEKPMPVKRGPRVQLAYARSKKAPGIRHRR